jgi:hypothetical protein
VLALRVSARFLVTVRRILIFLLLVVSSALAVWIATATASPRKLGHASRCTPAERPLAMGKRCRGTVARLRDRAFAAGAPGGLVVGVEAGIAGMGPTIASELAAVRRQTGSHWLRERVVWSKLEPARGRFRFARFDHFMLLAARRQMHVLALVVGTPAWAGRTSTTIPANPRAFAGFVAAVAGRYGSRGSLWASHPGVGADPIAAYELWNEPYYSSGDGGRYDPGRYDRLVKAAVTAGRAADPRAKFLLEAELTGAQVGPVWVNWIDAMYHAAPDLNRYFDGVSIHPYGPDLTGLSGVGDNQLRRTELIRRLFVRHGAAGKPLWITELGWPTCTTHFYRCVSYARQAASLSRLIGYLHGSWAAYVKAAFIYHYDDIGTNRADPETDYGLTTHRHRPKPALAVFRTLALTSSRATVSPRVRIELKIASSSGS